MEREGNVRSRLLLGRRGGVPAARRASRRRASATPAATLDNPTYEDVCSHTTGHAEVVEVTYDPERLSYDELLKVFWGKHDPTQLNRQGWDVGDQYRSVVFFHDAEQQEAALRSKAERADAALAAGRDADRARADLLRGGGLPPAVPREARPVVLHAGAAPGRHRLSGPRRRPAVAPRGTYVGVGVPPPNPMTPALTTGLDCRGPSSRVGGPSPMCRLV